MRPFQGGFESIEGDDTPLPPNIVDDLKKVATQFAEAAPYYILHPGSILENEWGFIVAGYAVGGTLAATILTVIRLLFGVPSAPAGSLKEAPRKKKLE